MKRFSSLAKITPPSFSGVYPRERLFKLLDQACSRPAVWISGPPGSGKTCLVSSYLNARKLRKLWYQADEGDADIATFFYYMRLAVPRVTPRRGTPLPLLTPEYLQGVLAFTRRYCQTLFKRLGTPIILVFDNYQEVPESSSFHEIIRAGVGELPKGVNVIFISRADPPPTLARLRANEIMETIGWNELRLTEEETDGITRLRGKIPQSDDLFRHLHEKTQGWVAGLILMLDQARLEGIPLQSLSEFTPEEIFDYFAGEIFQKTDDTTRNFLIKSAFLPRMTKKMAEELSGEKRAGQILSSMSQRNNFTTRHLQPEPVYQYHRLFQEFLLNRAQELMAPEDMIRVQQHAAMLLEKYGMVENAIKLLRDSGHWQVLVETILKWAAFLVEHGRMQTLEEWLSNLSPSLLNQHPWLLYWLGICRQPFEPKKSRGYLERAFTLFHKQEDAVGTFMSWCEIGIAIQSDESGNHYELDGWIATLDELMDEFHEFPSIEIHDRIATVMIIALTMRMPQHPMMSAWEERALSVFRTSQKPKVQAEIGSYLALYHLLSGDFSKAEVEVNVLRGLAQSREAPPIAMVLGRFVEALYYWRVGQFEECLNFVSAGLEVAGITGVHLWDYFFLAQGLSCALSMGDLENAREFLQKMAPDLEGPRRFVVCYYRYLASWEAYLRGNLDQALEHAETALQASGETGVPYFEGLSNLAMAMVQHTRGEPGRAIDYLAAATAISNRIKSRILEYACLLARSWFAMNEGDDEAVRLSLRKAFAIGKENDYMNFSWWIPNIMSHLCARALAEGLESDYVRKLIKKRSLLPDISIIQDTENWPWEIKIYTLGRFEIFHQDSRLNFTRKVQKRPLDLLKFVLAHGGHDVPEEKITGALWPDAEGDAAHHSFTIALHRLRKLLGNDYVIRLSEKKVSIDTGLCWVDYLAFERVLEQSGNPERSAPIGGVESMQRVQNAVSLYKGPFLPGDTEDFWSMKMRDRLRYRFIHYVARLAQELEKSGDWNEAADLYKKGLEADNLAEEFYRGLMRCYLRLHMKAEGLAVYQRCKTLLSVVLGARPSSDTENIHNSLATID